MSKGYKRVRRNGKRVMQHVLVAEKALGHPLPKGAVIHHVNEIKTDNSPSNLVICQNTAYHELLHIRTRIKKFGGNPNSDRVCTKCKLLKPTSMFNRDPTRSVGLSYCCKSCMNLYYRVRGIKEIAA